MSKTRIFKCPSCKDHPYQSRIYGEMKRVHNAKTCKPGETQRWTCTVCGKER